MPAMTAPMSEIDSTKARHTHDAAGEVAFELIACGKKCGVRTAEAEGHAKTLGASDGDVRAKFAGWPQQRAISLPVAVAAAVIARVGDEHFNPAFGSGRVVRLPR